MNIASVPPIVMAGVTFYVGLSHLALYYRQARQRENLTFALTAGAIACYDLCAAGLYSASSPAEGVLWQRGQAIILALTCVAIIWFVVDFTSHRSRRGAYLFSGCFLLAATIGLLDRSRLTWLSDQPSIKELRLPFGVGITYYGVEPGPLTTLQTALTVVFFVYCLWIAFRFYRTGQRGKAGPLFFTVIVLVVGVTNDAAVTGGLYRFVYMSEYAFMGIVLLMTYLLTGDVIEAALTREALQESEQKHRQLVEQGIDGIIIVQDRVIRYANKRMAELAGHQSAEELVGAPITAYLGPEELDRARSNSELSATEQATIPVHETVLNRQDGRQLLAGISTGRTSYQGEPADLVFVRDITARKQVEDALQQRNRELGLLNRAGRTLNSTLDLNQVLDAVLEEVRRLLGAIACSIWLVDRSTGELVCRQVTGPQREEVRGWRLSPGEGIAGWVARHGKSLLVPDVRQDSRHVDAVGQQIGLTIRSILSVPLKVKEGVIGVLQVLDESVGRFDAAHLALLEPLAASAATAIENAWLYDIAQQEIGERMRAEEELRRLKEFNEDIVQNMAEGIVVQDAEGCFTFVNPAMANLLGYRPGEMIGRLGSSVLPADQRSIVQAADERRARGKSDRYELELLCQDGQRINAEVNARPRIEDGRFAGSIAVFTNVTERKRAENTLRERANRMELIARIGQRTTAILERDELLDQAVELIGEMFGYYNVAILLVEGDYVVLRASLLPSASSLAGRVRLRVGSEGIAGRVAASGDPLLVPDVRLDDRYVVLVEESRTRSELAVPIELKGMVIGVLDVQSADCDAFLQDDVSTLQTVADQLAVALANTRLYEQIRSHAAQLEQRVAERTAELAAVNQELAAFSYSVSHDLRAPLRSMSGFSEALLEDYADVLDGTGQDYLRRVHQAGRRMAKLIDDLLNLSRLTRAEMSREPVDLSAVAQAIAAELQQGEPERRAEFIIAPGLEATGDPGLLRVVLENLLGNAWKFTSKVAHARIEFGMAEVGGDLAYFVRDNGAGFAMTYSDKLFGPFQRLHAESEFPGSGIGLATVQRIVFRHGGGVWAEGEEGRGAQFFFTLAARGGGE